MDKILFLDKNGTFLIKRPEDYNYLFFPIAGEKGIKSAVTPNLGGDCKLNQNAFVLEPVSVENLHNNKATRNFWCIIKNVGIWSATGQSAEAEQDKYTDKQDDSQLIAGLMWHELQRVSHKYGLSAKVTSFVPLEYNVEVMHVEITNLRKTRCEITPIAAIPIYGRSADNIRDHRHVTSLLHRICTKEDGVYVRPTLSFDERGHQKNTLTYFVCGKTGTGMSPVSFYPTVDEYIGEGGSYIWPRSVIENQSGVHKDTKREGKEAVGGLKFEDVTLESGQSVSYTIIIGATDNENDIELAIKALDTQEKVIAARERVKKYWQDQVNVQYNTGNQEYDNFMRWVSFQPFLRRIYGCSFLPYHDYGKGGRGWRDLWQDCLALLMMNPDGVREMIVNNYSGVRADGTNATIIGEKQGEFIADRNNITRVWMDHGLWPLMTTELYIEQTGDINVLNESVTYFKDRQVERGTSVDEKWSDEYGKFQKKADGEIYRGTILEHILLQNVCAFYEIGEHNHMRLRGADWNDALDMADERGESVAFTCAYVGNLKLLAKYIRTLKQKYGYNEIELMEEIEELITGDVTDYDCIEEKINKLASFTKKIRHTVTGHKIMVDAELLATNLEAKADWIIGNVRAKEWVNDSYGNGWFNSYYDNNGNQVEGEFENNVRMMLTGQVFAIMSKVATQEQMEAICKSAKKYLYNKEVGGYRINTNFFEEKYDMGRMFGFAYGEKENGAVFSHMTVMYANALYKNGFIREGYEALQTLADTAMHFSHSYMYPGIPEYFNAQGRGMYAYLTGAASWYMLTVITEVFGVKGEMGVLTIRPKLVAEQFDRDGNADIQLTFAGKKVKVCIHNPEKKDFGQYKVENSDQTGAIRVTRETLLESKDEIYEIHVNLI